MKVLFAGMTTSPIRSCPVHSHTSFEMILTLSGTGTAGAGPRRTSFEPGTVLVVPPGMPHFTDAEGYFEVLPQDYEDGDRALLTAQYPQFRELLAHLAGEPVYD